MIKSMTLYWLTLIAIVIGLGISGCRLPAPNSPLNPPTWIIGTWSDDQDIVTWTFTTDNALWSTGATTINFKESDGPGITISDEATDTSYTVQMSTQGVTQSYSFQKVDSTTITWMVFGLTLHKVVPVVAVTGVSVLPQNVIVQVGQSLQLTATIVPSNATDQKVLWSTSDDSVATVDSSGLVAALSTGSAVIMVTTNDGGKTATSEVTVVETPTPPTSPSPSSGGTTSTATPLLDWEDFCGATNYHIQVNTNNSFTGTMVVESSSLMTSQYQVASALSNGTTYYWRVRVGVDGLWSLWSSTWNFTVQVVPPSNPLPANGSTLSDGTPLLSWEDIAGATGYHVQVNTSSLFTGTMVGEDNSLASSQYETPSVPLNNSTYYWRVRTSAGGSWSEWSSVWSFTVQVAPPVSPSPSNGGNVGSSAPLLNWEDMSGATSYSCQINTDSSFTGDMMCEDSTLTASCYQVPINLSDGVTYYWRVKVRSGDLWGEWSTTWSFTVDLAMASGLTWTERTTAGSHSWYTVASSSDGMKLAAIDNNGGYIYTSTDGGGNWDARTSAGSRTWYALASSTDGTNLVAAAWNGYIYTSANGGATWTERTAAGAQSWRTIAISADGTRLVAGVYNGGLYTSANSGETWTEHSGPGTQYWYATASSSDGMKLVAAANAGNLYTSPDGGATWPPTPAGFLAWYSVASSADGSNLAAVTWGSSGDNWYVHTSTNSGTSWTMQKASGSRSWSSVASSADGNKIFATERNGAIFFSRDGGATWAAETSAGVHDWMTIAVSADGSRVVAATWGGYIYTGQ